MFNLLSKDEIDALKKEYRLRLTIVALCFFLGVILVASIALIPTIFVSKQREAIALHNDAALKASIAARDKDNLAGVLKIAKEKLAALKSTPNTLRVSQLFDLIISDKSAHIKITGLTLKAGDSGGRSLSVIGKASDRTSLLAFAHTLQNESLFSSVDLPVSNFAENRDIDFAIAIQSKM